MSFDSVFKGNPNAPNVTSSGKATFGVDLSSGQFYFKEDAVAGWQKNKGLLLFSVFVNGLDPGSYIP